MDFSPPAPLLEQILSLIKLSHPKAEFEALRTLIEELAYQNFEEFESFNAFTRYQSVLAFWQQAQRPPRQGLNLHIHAPGGLTDLSSPVFIQISCPFLKFFSDSVLLRCKQLGWQINEYLQLIEDTSGERHELPYWRAQISVVGHDEQALGLLMDELQSLYALNQKIVQDWQEMRQALLGFAGQHEDLEEADFIRWLSTEHFLVMGIQIEGAHAWGVCQQPEWQTESYQAKRLSQSLMVSRLLQKSPLQRDAYIDRVSIIQGGQKVHVFGLFTSAAYQASLPSIPWVKQKYQAILAQAPFTQATKWRHILERIPRAYWWQQNNQRLHQHANILLSLLARPRLKVLLSQTNAVDAEQVQECLVYLPRMVYRNLLRGQFAKIVQSAFACPPPEYHLLLDESPLAQLSFILAPNPDYPTPSVEALEQQLNYSIKGWESEYQALLLNLPHESQQIGSQYLASFTAEYQREYTPSMAITDAHLLAALQAGQPSLQSYCKDEALHLKVYYLNTPMTLSRCLHILENFGIQVVDERTYALPLSLSRTVWISDFCLQLPLGMAAKQVNTHNLEEAFLAVNQQFLDNDGFNRLVFLANITAREANILRAYWKYWRQTGSSYSQPFIEEVLSRHAKIARQLIDYFHTLLSPITQGVESALLKSVQAALKSVINPDEDKVLSYFLALIQNTVRTNFFQRDAQQQSPSVLAFKLMPTALPFLPEPKPMYEIFVYSTRIEGTHLRAGKVARGGIRWSTRFEDYRTEILGLLKAQMIKNAGIVPVGAKGGFVCKNLPEEASNTQLKDEVQTCYSLFIDALLSITDNLLAGKLVKPSLTICRDDDDPYLVVAADKGTAGFSDVANELAKNRRFWLRDAFASGGSLGYNHKALAITARGAWESIARHAAALHLDLAQPLSAVGIGDMSGDVFGNGVLLHPTLELIAAFDQSYIFLDPNPDLQKSMKERRRLFALPASHWSDYDPAAISKGGGVFMRKAKMIELSSQIKQRLGISQDRLTPDELIQAILCAPVSLLYNGGVGTFVKASTQSHYAANDRINDAIRVDASQLRCQMVAEGGNLGFTQAARIEFALLGGRIYSDSIDNAGGVECSDQEVNLKILLNQALDAGDLTLAQRKKVLRDLTPAVTHRVLEHHALNTLALEIAGVMAAPMLNVHTRFMQYLEAQNRLDRQREGLPSEEAIHLRKLQKQGLVAPELSVLLAYAKMHVYSVILSSDVPDDFSYADVLVDYFPRQAFVMASDALTEHPLKREIISTQLTLDLVDRMGCTFVFRLEEETGASPAHIARAWLACRKIFQADDRWAEIESLRPHIQHQAYLILYLDVRKLLERATRWVLRNYRHADDIHELVQDYGDSMLDFASGLRQWLPSEFYPMISQQQARYLSVGLPMDLAEKFAHQELLFCGLDIIQLQTAMQQPLESITHSYFMIGQMLQMDWLLEEINRLPRDNHWQGLARLTLRDDLYRMQRSLTAIYLQAGRRSPDGLQRWQQHHQSAILACQRFVSELRTQNQTDLAMLSSALREIRNRLLTG